MEKLELERKIKLLKERGIKGITIAEILGTSQSKVSKCEIEIDNEKVKEVLELIESKGQLKLNVEGTKNIDEEIEKIKNEIEEKINKRYEEFGQEIIKENEELKKVIETMGERYKKSKETEEENVRLKKIIDENKEDYKKEYEGIKNEYEKLSTQHSKLKQKAEILKDLYKEEVKLNLGK